MPDQRSLLDLIDGLLRGEATRLSALSGGSAGLPLRTLLLAAVLLSIAAGASAGSFSVIRLGLDGLLPLAATMVKLPALLLLTVLVTLPSLYVFASLSGSRLRPVAVLELVLGMVVVLAAVLASFGPIVVFFGLGSTSYPFMKLLNVAAAAVAGTLGLKFLRTTLDRLVLAQEEADDRRDRIEALGAAGAGALALAPVEEGTPPPPTQPADDADRTPRGPLTPVRPEADRRTVRVFRVWIVLFAGVGAQMSWVLRPLIGNPDLPFEWSRGRELSFFHDVAHALGALLGG